MAATNIGKVSQVMGPVVDVKFEQNHLPDLLTAVEIKRPGEPDLTVEVAQGIGADTVRCIAMGSTDGLVRGMEAVDTGKPIQAPVGENILGRMFNVLGQPIDGKGPVETDQFRRIERVAHGVIERKSVDTPLQTGIKAIDAMIPIGRGQRELIIGDRQTGKTAIALDAILNQKGKDVVCIYVAIGQKTSSVAQMVENLSRRGAMERSVLAISFLVRSL